MNKTLMTNYILIIHLPSTSIYQVYLYQL